MCYFISLFAGSNPYPGIENRKILGLLRRGYRMPQPQECPDELLVLYNNNDLSVVIIIFC